MLLWHRLNHSPDVSQNKNHTHPVSYSTTLQLKNLCMTTFPSELPEGIPNPGNELMGHGTSSYWGPKMRNKSEQVTGNGAVGLGEEETHLKNKVIMVQLIREGWSNGQKTGTKLFYSVFENISRSFSGLNLFIFAFHSRESYRAHVGPSTESQKHHKIVWQTGSQSHCISRKIPLLELNLRRYNNAGQDFTLLFLLWFLKQTTGLEQLLLNCLHLHRQLLQGSLSGWTAICSKPFTSPGSMKSHKLCAHTSSELTHLYSF